MTASHLNSWDQPWIVKVVVFVFMFNQVQHFPQGVRKRESCLDIVRLLRRLPVREILQKLDVSRTSNNLPTERPCCQSRCQAATRQDILVWTVCLHEVVHAQSVKDLCPESVTKLIVLRNWTLPTITLQVEMTLSLGCSHAANVDENDEFFLVVDIPLSFKCEGCHNHEVSDQCQKGRVA